MGGETMKKRILAWGAASLLLASSLAACGPKATTETEKKAESGKASEAASEKAEGASEDEALKADLKLHLSYRKMGRQRIRRQLASEF